LVPTPACKLCETRRPRRSCPGIGGDICAPCCGAEREITVNCPLECPYLQEARGHEKRVELKLEELPNRDVKVTERFLLEHQQLVTFVGMTLLDTALQTPGAVDADVREALESLIRTFRTLQSGLYYETRPANLLASAIHQRMQQHFEEFRQRERERSGLNAVRDAELLGVLVFWQRSALTTNNGRRLGRSFLGFLRDSFAQAGVPVGRAGIEARGASPLIAP
jgi:hypothetical protein